MAAITNEGCMYLMRKCFEKQYSLKGNGERLERKIEAKCRKAVKLAKIKSKKFWLRCDRVTGGMKRTDREAFLW